MKKIILFAIAFLFFNSAYSQNYGFTVSAKNSCVLIVTDLNYNYIIASFNSDELRWETKGDATTGLLTGLYFWDDSRSLSWTSIEADPVDKSNEVNDILAEIKLNRFECKQ